MEPDEFKRQLGERMRLRRKSAHMSQEQLAEAAGINPRYLSKIERGHALPSAFVAWRLASALSLPISSLLEDEPPAAIDELRLLLQGRSPEEADRVLRVVSAMLK